MVFYFSGTGNSRWAAQELGKAFNEKVVPIGEAMSCSVEYTLSEGERLGLVFPVYSWGPPPVIISFLESLRLSVPPSYFYMVCTCGDDTGKTVSIIQKVAARRGWVCRAAYSVVLPNTYVCMPGFDVDNKGLEKKKLQAAMVRMNHIINQLQAKTKEFDCHEGSTPWIKSYVIRPLFNRFSISPRKFHVSDTCISCGKCAKACPLQNVSLKDKKPVWGKKCALCLACYHHCPKHAIEYGKQTKNKGQYLHPGAR